MKNQPTKTQWQYLEPRSNSWRKQLYIKERKLRARTVWSDMIVNEDTPFEAAENWDLPLQAIFEIIDYCKSNQALLEQEAEMERKYLEEKGVQLEPRVVN
ncbi:MAG: hypothetical protein QNJ64_16810 [Crocosphaera sp.]|nr:hypothetical protein [Crocosphaera sp.]